MTKTTKFEIWWKDYENGNEMPDPYAPLFDSLDEAEAYIYDDTRGWQGVNVWAQQVRLCVKCHNRVGNSVMEEHSAYEYCHECLTTTH